jgi:hypothetical protein
VHEEYDLLFFFGASASCSPVVSNTSFRKEEESLFFLFFKRFSTKLLSAIATELLSASGGDSSIEAVVIDISHSGTQLLLPASGTGILWKNLKTDMATYESGQNKQEKVILRTKSPLFGLQRTHTSPLSNPPFRDPIFALCAPLWRCTFCQVNNPTQHTTKKWQRQRQKSPRLKKT